MGSRIFLGIVDMDVNYFILGRTEDDTKFLKKFLEMLQTAKTTWNFFTDLTNFFDFILEDDRKMLKKLAKIFNSRTNI